MTQETQLTEHDTEIARLRREHAAMLEIITELARMTLPKGKGGMLQAKTRALLSTINTPEPVALEWAIRVEDGHYFVHSTKTDECIACFDGKDSKALGWAIQTRDTANTTIASTPDTPPAGVTGSGARYGIAKGKHGDWLIIDNTIKHPDYPVIDSFPTQGEVIVECDRLNAADTVAGSGNGTRYIPKRHETSKFRYCVWDTETETALQIESERFIWTTLPRVKRECQRLNAEQTPEAARYVVKVDPPGAMFTFRKIVDTETMTELDGVYLSPEAAERECNRLNGGES